MSLYLVDDAVNYTVAAENPDGEVHLKARAVTRKLSFENGQLAARFEVRIYRDGEGFGFNASLVRLPATPPDATRCDDSASRRGASEWQCEERTDAAQRRVRAGALPARHRLSDCGDVPRRHHRRPRSPASTIRSSRR